LFRLSGELELQHRVGDSAPFEESDALVVFGERTQTRGGVGADPVPEKFLAIGDGARAWPTEAAAAGATRVRAKMAEAVELAALAGTAAVDAALGTAALAGRFGDGDLLSITGYQAAPGWDPVTGWGSPNAQVLVPLLARYASP